MLRSEVLVNRGDCQALWDEEDVCGGGGVHVLEGQDGVRVQEDLVRAGLATGELRKDAFWIRTPETRRRRRQETTGSAAHQEHHPFSHSSLFSFPFF